MDRRFALSAIAMALLPSLLAPAPAGAEPLPRPGGPTDHAALHLAHPRDLPRGAEAPERKSAYALSKSEPRAATGRDQKDSPVLAPGAVSGTAFIPVILAEFTDNAAQRLVHSRGEYEKLLFEKGYQPGAGSMRDYFLDQSGGLFDVTGQVSPWLVMPRTYDSYAGDRNGYQAAEPNDFTLVKDAVAAADPLTDFCRGDVNEDGFVDSLFIIHAGPGAEETGEGLWSLKWSLPSPYTTADVCANGEAVRVKTFALEPEEYASDRYTPAGAPSHIVSIGVFCHEFGHILGLPDLYDLDHSGGGHVGTWDVMSAGMYGFDGRTPWRPVPLSAWSKIRLGWAEAQNIAQDSPRVSVPAADRQRSGVFRGIYRIAPGGFRDAREYFLVENRVAAGYAADFPSGGIAIWHIDETRTGNREDRRPLVALVQADGRNDLADRGSLGDSGDLWPGSSGARGIDGGTVPSTVLYSGSDSKIALWDISDPGPSATLDVYVSEPAPAQRMGDGNRP